MNIIVTSRMLPGFVLNKVEGIIRGEESLAKGPTFVLPLERIAVLTANPVGRRTPMDALVVDEFDYGKIRVKTLEQVLHAQGCRAYLLTVGGAVPEAQQVRLDFMGLGLKG